MKTYFAISLLAIAAGAAEPSAGAQTLVNGQSEISFSSKQMGVRVDGRFKRFDAQIVFDPRRPEVASVALTIDLASATLGSPETQTELAKPEWFHTRQFPQATFRSTSVKSTAPGRFNVTGKLVIKGTSRDVTIPVAISQAGDATTAAGDFVIQRLDFKIGDGDWNDPSLVANDVQVRFKLTLAGVGPL